MTLGVNATPGPVQGEATAQVAATSGGAADPGQAQGKPSEKPSGDPKVRKANSEARGLRQALRDAQAKLETYAAQETEKKAKDGQYESLYHQIKAENEAIRRDYFNQKFESAVERKVGKRVKQSAIRDVMMLLPRNDIRFDGGEVDGLDEVLDDFLAERPWLLEEEGKEPKPEAGSENWKAAVDVGYVPAGHPGYRPSAQSNGRMPITDEVRELADRNGVSPEDMREILEDRAAKKAAREASGR